METEKIRDYFRIEIGWEEIYGNGDAYDESKVLVFRATDEKAAIRKAKTWWQKKNIYAANNFRVISIEQISSSQIEMSLALDPPFKKKVKYALLSFYQGKCEIENIFESEAIAEGEAMERNEEHEDDAWYFVKPIVQTTELSKLDK